MQVQALPGPIPGGIMVILAKTICVHCVFYCGPGVLKKPWHTHRCVHPENIKTQQQDPVTGEIGFVEKNDLGRVCISEDQYPHCRDINHGNCPQFKAK